MKAVVYSGPEEFAVREVPDPRPGPRQVMVRIERCGICKTDLHIHHGRFISRFPLTPGHEFCGEVVDRGNEVVEWKLGDHVTCDNTVLCGHCYYCRRNEPLYCENFYSLGCTGPGGLAEYAVVNADKAFLIPSHLSYDQAAIVEPLACVVHGADRLAVGSGDKVLIFGAGPAGILLSQVLYHAGAAMVVVAAPTVSKLELLSRLGVARTVLMKRGDFVHHAAPVREFATEGYDAVVEATGYSPLLEHACQFAKKGGKVLIYGVYNEEDRIHVTPYFLFRNEITLLGSFAQTHCFDRALRFLSESIVSTEGMITHRFPLEDYKQALACLAENHHCIKIMVHPNQ